MKYQWENSNPLTDLKCPLDGGIMRFVGTSGPSTQSVPMDMYRCPECGSTFTTVSDELVSRTQAEIKRTRLAQ